MMKIKLFTIPNLLTLANLICGSLAVVAICQGHSYKSAFVLIVGAAVFDFFDGFAARLLKQSSPLGGELDSLADMVSFGLAPALIMSALFVDGAKAIEAPCWAEYGRYIPFAIVACSALRLAKFNIDDAQQSSFVGLPTPACALFCISLSILPLGSWALGSEVVAALSLLLAWLLISPLNMFALKFKGYGLRGNVVRYLFLLLSAALLLLFGLSAFTIIVALYIVISLITKIVCHKA